MKSVRCPVLEVTPERRWADVSYCSNPWNTDLKAWPTNAHTLETTESTSIPFFSHVRGFRDFLRFSTSGINLFVHAYTGTRTVVLNRGQRSRLPTPLCPSSLGVSHAARHLAGWALAARRRTDGTHHAAGIKPAAFYSLAIPLQASLPPQTAHTTHQINNSQGRPNYVWYSKSVANYVVFVTIWIKKLRCHWSSMHFSLTMITASNRKEEAGVCGVEDPAVPLSTDSFRSQHEMFCMRLKTFNTSVAGSIMLLIKHEHMLMPHLVTLLKSKQ